MQQPARRNVSAFIVAGSALIIGLASLGMAVHNAAPATRSCPVSGIVKCIPAPSEHATAAFIAQPFAWVGFALILIALISAIIGAVHRAPPTA